MSLRLLLLTTLINIFHFTYTYNIINWAHKAHEEMLIYAGSLSSVKNIIPYRHSNLNICKPTKPKVLEDTLGEILSDMEKYSTEYKLNLTQSEYCKVLCKQYISQEQINRLMRLHNKKYVANYYFDKLPAGLLSFNLTTRKASIDYSSGIPFLYTDSSTNETFIYNHLQIRVMLHKAGDDTYDIVGFNILPNSIRQSDETHCALNEKDIINNLKQEPQPLIEGEVLFTYDVLFDESEITFASRWDYYKPSNKRIHWISIITSNVIVLLLSALIILILYRTIKKDVEVFNIKVGADDFIDEFGWKQVCNDVFRPGSNTLLYCACIGIGTQLFCMFFFGLFLSFLGFLNIEQRSNMLSILIIYYVLMGFPAGYISTRIYKLTNGRQWFKLALLNAVLFPGIVIGGYMFVNVILVIERSSASASFVDILALLTLWICCSSPLVLIGSFCGIKSQTLHTPCKVNAVPTAIPVKPFYFNFKFMFIIGGLIIFSTICIELTYVMASLWRHQLYFLISFLWIGTVLMLIVSTEVAIIFTYLNLCRGDYIWWWKSFFFGASGSAYIVVYAVYYYFRYLRLTRMSAIVVYFGLMGLLTSVAAFISGAIATLGTFLFLRKIYGMIKID